MTRDDPSQQTRRSILKSTGLVGSAAAMTALAGCAGGGGDATSTGTPESTVTEAQQTTVSGESAKYGGKLVYSSGDDSQKLDPHYRVTKASAQLLIHVVEPLFRVNNKLQPEPALVKDFKTSEDNRTYTFTLHEGVKFHSPVDRELVAADVVATLNRIRNDKSAAAYADLKRIESVKATGDYTVEMTLKEPFAPILNVLAEDTASILPREYFDKMSSHPVGTGPFQFVERQRGNFAKLEKFEDYRIKEYPYFDKVESRPISDGSVRLDELKTGNVHVATTIPSKDADAVRKNDSLSLEPVKGMAIEEFAFNNDVKPFDDPRVRKAVAYACDNQKLIKFALQGLGSTAITTLPPQSPYALDGEPLSQDFTKAKQLLKDAGHGDGFKTTIKLPKSYPRSVKIGTPIQQWLGQIGIDAKLQRVTWDTWISDVFGSGNFEMTSVPFYGAYTPHIALYKIFHTDETFNFFNYSNSKVDTLLEEGAQIVETEKRKEKYLEAQRLIREDLPIFLPFYRTQLFARRKSVQNRLTWGTGEMRAWRNWFAEE